ncbi:methyl-accepting chemotaxis protein [Pelomonas sp. KK5]|uniref:methyl-accepting chemotaxis protein n=1 Tax=Pelomonas sp. KK5 TaxID=1855730 RepID=UPI00097C1ABC|nr:methyl-accepting chemotaxis protein [Pelomonas sp. KK5]
MSLRQLRIRARLLLGFGLILLMTAVLVGIGAFGLNVAQNALFGITHQLIPTSNITVGARTKLIESQAATATMVASIFNDEEMKKAKARWDAAQKDLDKSMADFAAIVKAPEQKKNLDEFRTRIEAYRKAVEPAAATLLSNGFAEGKDALEAMRKGDAAYDPARAMLEGLEATLAKNSQTVFEKVDSVIRTIFGGLIIAFVVCCVLGLVLAWRVSRSIVEPMDEASRFAERIAAGDLRAAPAAQGADEAAAMMRALASMQGALAEIVGQVRESSESIQVASSEVASGNLDLSSRTEQTASNLQQTASSMSELTGVVGQSAESANTAKQLAGTAAETAGRGGEVVSRVVSTMGDINSASKKIADIIGTIDGIAFQTNILALNAAVEAARAGEQGRGFAVVASEVRSLAQRSAEAAREIKALIGASVDKVEAGTVLVSDAGSTMSEIVSSVQRVADIIGEISAAASEQSSGIGRVNGAVGELDQMTQQNAALVEQSAAAAQSLKEQAQRLSGLMSRFTLT